VTADSPTPDDIRIDRTNLLEYLEGENGAGRAAGPILKEAIVQAYTAEFGLAPEEQSCLNFLLYIHADRRSKFTPFGIFSDERWHVVSGNDRIAAGLTADLAIPPEFNMRLIRVRKTAAGAIELTFSRGASTIVRRHDYAVLAIPFSVLRAVELDANLGLPANQRAAIDGLGYGTNAKMMLGFTARPWVAQGSNGTCYAELPNVQTVWETSPTRATASRAILTDYSGGARGANLNTGAVQTEAARFLADLNRVYPGVSAVARRNSASQIVAHLEHWPSNPLALGSYTCYLPGQFTSMAGLEGRPAGNLLFAGEHANSFYDAQGFMEGAALSGIQAAADVLAAVKRP
jgi:monoamine oxidase